MEVIASGKARVESVCVRVPSFVAQPPCHSLIDQTGSSRLYPTKTVTWRRKVNKEEERARRTGRGTRKPMRKEATSEKLQDMHQGQTRRACAASGRRWAPQRHCNVCCHRHACMCVHPQGASSMPSIKKQLRVAAFSDGLL
eukprot:353364-Chlamydomonas_euryale.AAC.14